MSEQSLRFNENKLRWALVDFESLEELVRVLEAGAIKYSPQNWQKGLNREEILESMQRHLIALFKGEENDPDLKTHHMGNIMCNAMFYLYHLRNQTFAKERNNPFKK